jgi:hypothetical protein
MNGRNERKPNAIVTPQSNYNAFVLVSGERFAAEEEVFHLILADLRLELKALFRDR